MSNQKLTADFHKVKKFSQFNQSLYRLQPNCTADGQKIIQTAPFLNKQQQQQKNCSTFEQTTATTTRLLFITLLFITLFDQVPGIDFSEFKQSLKAA